MSFKPRLRLPRRRQSLQLESGDHPWSIFHPGPDDSIVVAEFSDAVMLATEVFDLPVCHEVLVLLDERRRITAMLLDPPAEVGLLVGMVDIPGVIAAAINIRRRPVGHVGIDDDADRLAERRLDAGDVDHPDQQADFGRRIEQHRRDPSALVEQHQHFVTHRQVEDFGGQHDRVGKLGDDD